MQVSSISNSAGCQYQLNMVLKSDRISTTCSVYSYTSLIPIYWLYLRKTFLLTFSMLVFPFSQGMFILLNFSLALRVFLEPDYLEGGIEDRVWRELTVNIKTQKHQPAETDLQFRE